MLCDFRDDNSQCASFLSGRNLYATYMPHTEDSPPHHSVTNNSDHMPKNSDHVTTFQFPCDIQVMDPDTPDVIYSPRIPKDGGFSTCQACRNTHLYSAQCPKFQHSQSKRYVDNKFPTNMEIFSYSMDRNSPKSEQPERQCECLNSQDKDEKVFEPVVDNDERSEKHIVEIVSV